jgi:hypothetical protein
MKLLLLPVRLLHPVRLIDKYYRVISDPATFGYGCIPKEQWKYIEKKKLKVEIFAVYLSFPTSVTKGNKTI